MRNRSRSAMQLIVAVAALGCASTAPSQSSLWEGVTTPTSHAVPADAIGADVGAGWNILSIHASGFQERTGTYITDDFLGYRRSPKARFETPLLLPSGAGIGYVGVFGYDTNTTAGVEASIRRYTGYGQVAGCNPCGPPRPPAVETIVSVTTSGENGYQYARSPALSPMHAVNNNVAVADGGQYVVYVEVDEFPGLGQLGFRGVEIWWKRQISPAPSTASFVDVPTTHQFFREIEALAAAGVTLGCTATEFCATLSVTRAQMAAFLARALGLYWQF